MDESQIGPIGFNRIKNLIIISSHRYSAIRILLILYVLFYFIFYFFILTTFILFRVQFIILFPFRISMCGSVINKSLFMPTYYWFFFQLITQFTNSKNLNYDSRCY